MGLSIPTPLNRKEVNEIKKAVDPDKGVLHTLYTCYVSAEKQRIFSEKVAMASLKEEDAIEYAKIFKKLLSPRIERNFLNLSLQEEEPIRRLHALTQDEVEEDEIEGLFDALIAAYENEAGFVILLAKGKYYVSDTDTSDRALAVDDGVYSFILVAICPVDMAKPNLSYRGDTFTSPARDQIIAPPNVGFLFPGFTGRQADVNELGYYVRKEKEPHPELQAVLGVELPLDAQTQKDVFLALAEKSFGGKVPKEAMVRINEFATEFVAVKEDENEKAVLQKQEIEKLLEGVGAGPVELEEEIAIMAGNIAQKDYVFLTDGVKVIADVDAVRGISIKKVDGRRALVIPCGEVTLNGAPME